MVASGWACQRCGKALTEEEAAGTDPPGHCYDCAIAIGQRPRDVARPRRAAAPKTDEGARPFDEEEFGPRYAALRLIATILRTLAWIVLIGGLISSLSIATSTAGAVDENARFAVGAGSFVGGAIATAIATVILFAVADLILVLLDIEENTRSAAENTLGLWEGSEKQSQPPRSR